MTTNWECIEWRGLYGEGWGAEIVPEAFAHPAKYSRALIRRIYQEMTQRGWLSEGDTVIDPFGGVALGGLDAMLAGLNWQGCELEPRFVALAQANIDLWNRRYAAQMPHWGTARNAQGDSRKLRSVLASAGALVSSPPYAKSAPEAHGPGIDLRKNYETYRASGGGSSWEKFVASRARHQDGYGNTDGQLGAMPEGSADSVITSPPYASSDQDYKSGWARFHAGHEPLWRKDSQREAEYGQTPGQLGAMPEGVVSSPPYAKSLDKFGDGIDWSKAQRTTSNGGNHQTPGASVSAHYGESDGQLDRMAAGDLDATISSPPFLQTSGGVGVRANAAPGSPTGDARLMARHAAGNAAAEAYGASGANLGNMREGEAVVSSPPFGDDEGLASAARPNKLNSERRYGSGGQSYLRDGYGETVGQLGTDTGDTFWTAARSIVAETFAVLRPGAHAAWVVKGFVRNRKLVDFPDQWRQLCESVGFVTVAEVRAWVVEDKGTQLAMHGDDKRHVISRKSFFRRLAEKKGSPPIDYETVWMMEKPR